MQKDSMFRWLKLSCLGALVLPLSALAGSCSNLADECENTNTCKQPAGDAGDAGSCNDPSTQPCTITNERGVFVSPTGNDGANGTREQPFKTLNHALSEAARVGKKRVFACADGGDYAETLEVNDARDGLSIYGGFRCSDWSYASDLRAKIVSRAQTAIRVRNLTQGLLLENWDVSSANGTSDNPSSIGVFVSASAKVRLRRVKVTAGTGADGADGVALAGRAQDGAPGNKGTDACLAPADAGAATPAGGAPAQTACGDLPGSTGGKGGDGATGGANGGDAVAGMPALGGGNAGKGQTGDSLDCTAGFGLGDGGRNGSSAEGVGAGADGAGTLTQAAYTPAAGADGPAGTPGQGGGGGGGAKAPDTVGKCGAGVLLTGASGGSGGAGGCGGKGGAGGKGGGASMALASFRSNVSLEDVQLVAQSGGKGGDAAQGQAGGRGGGPGAGGSNGDILDIYDGCAGGPGGRGGNGAPGGGGAGGASIGIAYVGTAPTRTGGGITYAPAPAVGGLDGAGNNAAPGAGAAGVTAEQYELGAQ